MAAEARRRSTRYEVYGNVAYDPVWEGGAIAAPAPERQEVLQPRPKVRPRERTLARPRVQVREAGAVSPFAVIGFFAVGVMAVLLLMSYVNLTVISDETVQLRSELSALREEEAKLLAQYELAYDWQALETQLVAEGSMVKPGSSQMVVLDLSEPDSVIVYDQTDDASGLLGKVGNYLKNLVS